MLLPSLCALDADHLLADDLRIICTARSDFDTPGFRNEARQAIEEFLPAGRRGSLATFLNRIEYQPLDATTPEGYRELADKVGPDRKVAIFLSTAPSLFEPTIKGLADVGLCGNPAYRSRCARCR